MSQDLTLFAGRSPEEIDAIFDTYIEDGFEDVPADVFFATLALMDQKQPVRHIQPEGALNSNHCASHTLGVELIDDKVVRNLP